MFEFEIDIKKEKITIGRVPTLVLRSTVLPQRRVGVLWMHGGGYMFGMKEMACVSRAMDLVKNYGVTVFSPGYRLSWQEPYPAALVDCFSVLCYMDKNKTELGIDTLMVGGESAGGGLCAAVCMLARDRGIKVLFQMPLYPMLSNFDTNSSRDNHAKVWNTRRNHLGWKLYLRENVHRYVSPYASPSRQKDYSNLPSCYTFVGDGDPFYEETVDYVKHLKDAGVDASIDIYHTNYHAFDVLLPEDSLSRKAIEKFRREFERALEQFDSSTYYND